MGRKKEPQRVEINRERVISIAKTLFYQNGIQSTKIDEIAKQAGMSKSTLYVYFRSKEEILDAISLEAMQYFYCEMERLFKDEQKEFYDEFMEVCFFFVSFKKKYPLSFQLLFETIDVSDNGLAKNERLKDIFDTGEKINALFFLHYQNKVHFHDKKKAQELIFILWGSIYGLITLADNKEVYMEKSMLITKEQFLKAGFLKLYHMILEEMK